MEVLYKFDFRFLQGLYFLLTKLFKGSTALYLFLLVVIFKLIEEYVTYQVGLITSDYYKIMGEKDVPAFWRHTLKSLGLISAIALLLSFRKYVTSVLYAFWRETLTAFLHRLYFKNNNYYVVNVLDKVVDNPDQRITQDVDKMCLSLSTVIPTIIISPFTIAYYVHESYLTTGWLGPGGVFGYFLVGTIINKLLMSSVVHFVYLQEKFEGYFRFKHMQVRTNAEAIAFQCGQKTELRNANQKLDRLVSLQHRLFLRQLPLDISVNLFSYFGSILSFLILAGPLFTGKYNDLSPTDLSALISKNAFVSIYLVSCFSNLVNLSEEFATLAGTTHRICQLSTYLQKRNATSTPHDRQDAYNDEEPKLSDSNDPSKDSLLIVSNLTVESPGLPWTVLLQNLSFQVNKNCNLLITGQSGCGKTTLLRILSGLFEPRLGSYSYNTKRVFFLPQKPLLTDGSIRDQISYPKGSNGSQAEDDLIRRLLDEAELSSIVDRTGGLDTPVDWDWYEALSPGEAQRLCFIRLLYHCPTLAFLDEALGAVNPQLEHRLYQQAIQMGITLVSVAHRQSLTKYHKYNLHLQDGNWNMQEL